MRRRIPRGAGAGQGPAAGLVLLAISAFLSLFSTITKLVLDFQFESVIIETERRETEREISKLRYLQEERFQEERENLEMNETSQTERIMFPCTQEFKSELEQLAQSQNKSISQLIKECCIEQLKMKSQIPVTTRGRVSKYKTEEERIQANKEYRKNRNELMRKLMREYKAKHS